MAPDAEVKLVTYFNEEVVPMRIMLIQTNENPRIIEVEHSLRVFQELVGGFIEVVEPFDDGVVIVCNETGRNEGLAINRVINATMDICGDFFLCGQDGDGELTDFPAEKEIWYSSLFHLPS